MAYALGLGPNVRKDLRVRLSPAALELLNIRNLGFDNRAAEAGFIEN